MTKEELQGIRERVEKATKGKWIPSQLTNGYICTEEDCEVIASVIEYNSDGTIHMTFTDNHKNNRQFIAHAREDIPKLLDEIDRLRDIILEAIDDLENISPHEAIKTLKGAIL